MIENHATDERFFFNDNYRNYIIQLKKKNTIIEFFDTSGKE